MDDFGKFVKPLPIIYNSDLKSIRKVLGMNQKKFGEIFGVSKFVVGRWETCNKDENMIPVYILKLKKFVEPEIWLAIMDAINEAIRKNNSNDQNSNVQK